MPRGRPEQLDPREPEHVSAMAEGMGLRHVVITSVNRDELPDGGAAHWAATVRSVRARLPHARIEVLTPDFCGNWEAIATVVAAGADIFNHNVETVPRLYSRVRPQARYQQSLEVLALARRLATRVLTKSGLMLGLGETREEVEQVLRDLHAVHCDVATIGQYLQPTRHNLPVAAYIAPSLFESLREFGLRLGFREVFSGPLVRSSYMADRLFESAS